MSDIFKTLGKIVLLTVLYAGTGKLGLSIAVLPTYATAIWPPSGIALGMMLVCGYRLWPGVFLGSFLLNAYMGGAFASWEVFFTPSTLLPATVAVGATLQAVVGVYLLRAYFSFPLVVERARDALLFLMLSGPFSCLISATVSNSAFYLAGELPQDKFLFSWLTWWMGDSFGVLAFMPLVLVFASSFGKGVMRNQVLYPLPPTAMIAVFLSVVLTFTAWKTTSQNIYEKNHSTFRNLVAEIEKALMYRIDSYEKSLLSGAGFFAGSEDVSREEWREYARWLNLEKNYPGMHGIGYIVPVAKDQLDAYEQQQRASGAPDFTIKPDRNADEFSIVTFIEPLAENKPGEGMNIAFDPARNEAAILSRDSGYAAMTRRIALLRDGGHTRRGFLLLYPIYHKGMPIETRDERRAAHQGWIYAPFIARHFMADLMGEASVHDHDIDLQVYDGEKVVPEELIYDGVPSRDKAHKPAFHIEKSIDVKQQLWTLAWSSTPTLEKRMTSNEPLVILFGGMAFTSLLAMFLIVVSRRTEVVQQQVDVKTHEIVASEQRMRMLIRHTPAAVAMFDKEMRYIMTSERWLQDYDMVGQNIIGMCHYDLFPEIRDMPEWLEHHQRVLKGETLSRDEDAWQRPNGRTEWVRWALHPWRDNKGKIGGIIMFTEVITEAKKSKAELLRSYSALEEFAYVVSHDLKAPLRHMSMCAGFLQESHADKLGTDGRKFLDIITESSIRMRDMIDHLLDYARIGGNTDDFRDVDIEQVLADATHNLTPVIDAAQADVQSGRLPTVRGVHIELVRVFQNLIENAIKYRREDEKVHIRVDAQKVDKMWQISVADNGIGIDPRFADKIFMLFQRLHPDDSPYGGAGIGLAACQRIIRYHGGSIRLDPDYQGGSRFLFTLPDYAETKVKIEEGDNAA